MTQLDEPAVVRIMTDGLGYDLVAVNPDFGRADYATVFALLQATPGPKVLDLSEAAVISSDLFETLVASWKAAPGRVPRLGIVLAFHHWAVFRGIAAPALPRLAAKGVVAQVFYDEQTWGTSLLSWFAEVPIFHNVAGVVESLRTRWQPSGAAPLVLAALSELLLSHTREHDGPELFTEVARIALWCGDPEQATTFARETLRRAGEAPSVLRCKALRTLGVALVSQGQTTEGLLILDDAIAMAALVGAPVEGASARCQAGLYALNHQDYPRAEHHFRRGIELLAYSQPDLLATLYHNLALAMLKQGSRDAVHYVLKALALRTDRQSRGAQDDQELLARIRDGSAIVN